MKSSAYSVFVFVCVHMCWTEWEREYMCVRICMCMCPCSFDMLTRHLKKKLDIKLLLSDWDLVCQTLMCFLHFKAESAKILRGFDIE